MGTVFTNLGDVGYQHEGYVAHILDDGTLTGSYSRDIDPRKTGKLQADCECEWTGSRQWDNDNEDPTGFPSEELEGEILADWEAHVRAVAGVERGRQHETLVRVLRGIGGRLADDVAGADVADVEVLKRAIGELQYAAELAQRMTPEDG